jgi:hypothetical protein
VVSREKLLAQILSASSDENVSFDGLISLLHAFGFRERVKGSHHIFSKDGIPEILNLQPRGTKAKAYQVKQVRNVFVRYKLVGDDDE